MIENEDAPTGYKLLLVPEADIAASASGDPNYVYLSLTGPAYQVIADVGADRRLRMSRPIYDRIEVIG